MPSLKIAPLPDRTPVKLSIAVPPELQSDLQDYAAVYKATYGQDAKVVDLVPSMLKTFLAGDTEFRRARKRLHSSS